MFKYGENIIDILGVEVDRFEKELKVRCIYNNNLIMLISFDFMLDIMLIVLYVYFYFFSNFLMYWQLWVRK